MAPTDDSDNRVPRLVNRADFKNWTIRLRHHLCSIDNDLWKSIEKVPHIPTQTAPDSASTYTKDSTEPYPEDNLSAEDLRKVKNDSKAYSLMCKGLPLQVLSRLDAYQTGYTCFKALKSICEGGEQLRSLKKSKLKRQLELFEHINGETVHQMMNRFVHLTTEMSNLGVKTELQDLNDRLLCALPSSWKQTVTLLKHTEKFPMELDLLIGKIEEVEIDEGSRNTDRSSSQTQYKYVVNPANTVENAFLAQDAMKLEDEGDLFVGASFYTDSAYFPNSPTYSQPQSPPRAQVQSQNLKNQSESQSSNIQAKVKDVKNILLQDDETKTAFTTFMASFQAYQGSHLSQMDVVLQDLFEMDPVDVEEMDLNWQMVMVAYRTQKHAYVNQSYKPHANKTVGFDKSKARCFNCNQYGHFSRECKAPKNQNFNDQASSSNQGQSQSSQQSSSYQSRNQRFFQKPYQSLPMPELKDEGKKPEDQTKALVVSVKDSYDWSAYAEQFTSDLTSSLALVCEIEEDWSEEGDGKMIENVSEDSEDYDWSAKSDPTEESESEIALMATASESSCSTEQPKVSNDLPPNYVPLPIDVKERLCSEQCIQQVEHYRTHSFKIGDKLSKHEKIHEQLKIDHKISDEKILSLKESWNKTLKELELVTKQLEEMTKNFEQEKVAHAVTQVELTKVKSCKTMVKQLVSEREIQRSKSESEGSEVLMESLKEEDGVTTEADDEASNESDNKLEPVLIQLIEYPELNPKSETMKEEGEFSGYNDPDYIKWKKEQKAQVADQLIKKQEVKKAEVSTAKKQKSKVMNNQSETKESKGKSVIKSNDNTKAQSVKSENVKPVKKKVTKGKTIKFVSAGTFDLNGSYGKPINSPIKSNSGLKTGSGPKSSAVNEKRIESKKVTKQNSLKSNQSPMQSKSQTKSPQKNQVNLKPNKTDNESRMGSTSKVNNRLFRISKKHCEICDRYNHATAECFFNRYCSYCDKRNHSSEECFYNKFCDICERRNHDTKDCFFRTNSTREMTPISNFRRNQSFGFQNVNQSHSPVLRNFNRNNSGLNNFASRNMQVRPRRPINSWFVDSGCSRHMTGNHALLQDFKLKNGTHVAFGGDAGGKITGEGTVSNGVISFDKVNYCAQLNFNLLSVSQICDKSYSTLFDDSFCYILKPGFKIDNEWVVVKAPRDRDVYKLDISQIDAETETTCLIAHASNDESQLWHRRLGHSNFRNMNRLVTGNHVVGIPSKKFSTTDLCPACLKGKQHRMSFKSKQENSISKPLQMLHMDLFGPTNVQSIGKKSYCFVIIDDFTRFSWCSKNASTKRVAERKNRTLIEAARSMLADAKIPITFWDEAIATACFVQNRTLLVQDKQKTSYELLFGRKPNISYLKAFGCPVSILNLSDHLGKFESKSDDGFFLAYSSVSKAYRVFNSKTNTVIETINVKFLENSFPLVAHGPEWLFDLDSLSKSFNSNLFDFSGKTNKESGDLGCFSDDSDNDDDGNLSSEYPFMSFHNPDHVKSSQDPGPSGSQEDQESNNLEEDVNLQVSPNDGGSVQNQPSSDPNAEVIPESFDYFINSPDQVPNFTPHTSSILQDLPNLNTSNLECQVQGGDIPIHRIHKKHPVSQIIGPLNQRTTRSQTEQANVCLYSCFLSQVVPKNISEVLKDNSWIEAMQEELLQFRKQEVWKLVDLPEGENAIGTRWLYKNKPDERGIVVRNKARLIAQGYTQEEGIDYEEVFAPVARLKAIRVFLAYASFMKFKVFQMDVKGAFLYGPITDDVYVRQPPGFEDPDYPHRVYKLSKALYGLHQAPRIWYETLSKHLLEHGFTRGQIDPTLFMKRENDDLLCVQVYVDDIIFGSTSASICKEFEEIMKSRFQMSSTGEINFFLGLQVKQSADGIFINQSKFVEKLLKKFKMQDFQTIRTPSDVNCKIQPDPKGKAVDQTLYRSMIGSLMYLTASRPDIMYAVCVCARYQSDPKESHLVVVKRIFRYLKGKPNLGLWYPYEGNFELYSYSDSDFGGCALDRKSTTGGCQFLGPRLVSWQCKKQTNVSVSTAEAEYIAASAGCSQVLWLQNQLLDYGFNFLKTPIYIDNTAAMFITANPVQHSKTKHIEIRYHFLRDNSEKGLIILIKVHTDKQLADLFTKSFLSGRFEFLVQSIGLINHD
ncbi:hypothetical protein QVD17_12293 [Tagetes erecta]|uniref:CCHC-type domain-containing protein n=1 Tax=Tagetes erecta TaxID=13708 RepID=A0AAD8KYU6_TARER|nr:hypothetical protein QVD17_12293 [Tagetes erecta]